MDLSMFKCPECWLTFGVDKKAIGDDELVTCPKCDAEVDVEEDEAVVR
jgi:predicted nucleic acid-binding Zn ribbon protein